MSTTRDSIHDLMQLQERMNQLFQQTFSAGGAPEEAMGGSSWSPPVDIQETPDRIVLRADLPGIPIEQIELKIENERLILRGERAFESMPGGRISTGSNGRTENSFGPSRFPA